MIAVMTRRQVDNGQLRAMGIRPELTYHWHVVPGDRVRVQVVEQEPFAAEVFFAVVQSVEHGGRHSLVYYTRDNGECGSACLYHNGPPDWGIVEFKVVEAVPRRPIVEDPYSADRDPEDALRRLVRPQRCPECRALCDAKPKVGWPCLECRAESYSLKGA